MLFFACGLIGLTYVILLRMPLLEKFLRKEDRGFLSLGQGHISRKYQKSKRCFYCKGSHNSAICENKITKNYVAENSQINSSTNYSANSSCVLLQTAEIILVNLVNKREIKLKTLFNQGSQRSYITGRVKSFFISIHVNFNFRKQDSGKEGVTKGLFEFEKCFGKLLRYRNCMYRIYLYAI